MSPAIPIPRKVGLLQKIKFVCIMRNLLVLEIALFCQLFAGFAIAGQQNDRYPLFQPAVEYPEAVFHDLPPANEVDFVPLPAQTELHAESNDFVGYANQGIQQAPGSPAIGETFISPDFIGAGGGVPTSLQLPTVEPIFSARANLQAESADLIAPYQNRAGLLQSNQNLQGGGLEPVPNNGATWWTQAVGSSVGIAQGPIAISLDSMIAGALRNAPQVQVAATEPHIQRTAITEESGEFDWRAFLETRYDDLNDPIGNELTTGDNADRFTQQEWFARGGARRKNIYGGETEIAQRIGYLDNNSVFLIPPDQGNARLELNYRQPLLRGRGRAVNESLIVLANIDANAASDDFMTTLQSHLFDVTRTYWELVRARAEYLQRKKLLHGAQYILKNLEGRSQVDSLDRQVLRARAAVAKRNAEIARALASIKNAESQLRLLVNDPQLIQSAGMEFTPTDVPLSQPLPITMADAISTALTHRPEISKAIRDIRAASVLLGVSRNDLLPKLDFLVGTYVAGLDGDSDFANAWVSQFRDGRPGFNVGLEYEFPVGNRTAKARAQRRQWESARALQQFRAVVETSLTDVELAVREVDTTYREMHGRYYAMVSARTESEFLIDRWKTLPEVDDSVTLLLEDLLDSQERLADEEAALARAQTDYAIAIVQLKKAMGTLFRVN